MAQQVAPGVPGSVRLPNPGEPGTAFTNVTKMHPSAWQGPSRQNPLNMKGAGPGLAPGAVTGGKGK